MAEPRERLPSSFKKQGKGFGNQSEQPSLTGLFMVTI